MPTYFLVKIDETPAKLDLIIFLQDLEAHGKAQFHHLTANSDLEAINKLLDSFYPGNNLFQSKGSP
jgi:hypothetical protein